MTSKWRRFDVITTSLLRDVSAGDGRCYLECMLCCEALQPLEQVKNNRVKSHGMIVTLISGMILGLRPANERRRYKVTPSLIGWAQT